MRTINVRLCEMGTTVIQLGFAGENLHTRILFDSTKLFEEYPDAVPSLSVKPPEGDVYPSIVTRNGNTVIWDVDESDLAHEGLGEIQLAFVVNGVVAKSYVAMTSISRSIVPAGEVPEPIDDWLTRANAALAEIPEAVEDAVEEAVAEAEGRIEGNVADAEAWAKGTRNGEPVASDDPAYHNNSKHYSEQAAVSGAEQVALVEAAGAAQLGAVNEAGTTQVGNVNTAGSTQVGNVNTAGAAQVAAIEEKGEETLESIPSDYTNLSNEVGELKSAVTKITNNNKYYINFTTTNTSTTAKRKVYMYPFIMGEKYNVTIRINQIPSQHGNTHIALATANSGSGTSTSKVEGISPDYNNLQQGFSDIINFSPTANAEYFYIYYSCETGDINIDINITALTSIENDSKNYNRVASITRISGSAQRYKYPYSMVEGITYKFKIFLNLINPLVTTSSKSIAVLSAINENANIRDSILGIRSIQSNSNLVTFGKWNVYEYTALNNTDYLELYIAECDAESVFIVDVQDNCGSLPDYLFNELSIKNDGRLVYDIKPYPFKNITTYSGSGQAIVERNGEIYIFTNGTMYKYVDLNIVSTSGLFAHPINASLMLNNNILVSDITDYNTENEVRHIYEYNPDTNTIINDYTPIVSGKHLVLSEEIDSSTLLVAYKDDNETDRIIYWYSYSITDGIVTAISQTPHDRIYTQGCSLRGDLVYVMTNNINTSPTNPAKVLVIKLSTGAILNEIVFDNFGETEGFYITYSKGFGTYVFTLDNGNKSVYLIKLI